MAHGIQYIQATQFIELLSSGARGIPELRSELPRPVGGVIHSFLNCLPFLFFMKKQSAS
jgi:hypothetical protein